MLPGPARIGVPPEAPGRCRCDHRTMRRTKTYRRTAIHGIETLKVVAYIDEADGEDEIRVTHTVGSDVVDDGIGFHGRGGGHWLQDRHTRWTAHGFELISSGPDY
jgi:hypothetical protein